MFESFIGRVYGDGLLADSVDTTLSIIVVQHTKNKSSSFCATQANNMHKLLQDVT